MEEIIFSSLGSSIDIMNGQRLCTDTEKKAGALMHYIDNKSAL